LLCLNKEATQFVTKKRKEKYMCLRKSSSERV